MLGRLERREDRWELRFTRSFPHPPEKVWRAITEPEHLAVWFPSDIEGERTTGAKLRFVFRNGEGSPIDGEMLACDPPSLLEFVWGDETLRFELRPTDGGTELTFLNTFDEKGKAARDGAGWHACLDVLECVVAGDAPPWSPQERWGDVHPQYVDAVGPEAATIGPPEGMDL
jgi:uncharacterized protein YndB with AHSA1/START domain